VAHCAIIYQAAEKFKAPTYTCLYVCLYVYVCMYRYILYVYVVLVVSYMYRDRKGLHGQR